MSGKNSRRLRINIDPEASLNVGIGVWFLKLMCDVPSHRRLCPVASTDQSWIKPVLYCLEKR